MKPILGLRVFPEDDPVHLYKYYEWFKGLDKKQEDRKKRFEKRCVELHEELKNLLPNHQHLAVFTPESLIEIEKLMETGVIDVEQEQDDDGQESNLYIDIEFLHKQYKRTVDNYNKKEPVSIDVANFKPEEIEVKEELVKILSSEAESQKAYYGFLWRHPLEKSPDYEGHMTFEDYRNEQFIVGPVEVKILEVAAMESKKKTKYWLLYVEDANSEEAQVQVWQDDWERFKEELIENQFIKLKVKAPDAGFRRYTLDSPPRHQRWKLPKDKSLDARVVIMRK